MHSIPRTKTQIKGKGLVSFSFFFWTLRGAKIKSTIEFDKSDQYAIRKIDCGRKRCSRLKNLV